jgi:hypothetical protein
MSRVAADEATLGQASPILLVLPGMALQFAMARCRAALLYRHRETDDGRASRDKSCSM